MRVKSSCPELKSMLLLNLYKNKKQIRWVCFLFCAGVRKDISSLAAPRAVSGEDGSSLPYVGLRIKKETCHYKASLA